MAEEIARHSIATAIARTLCHMPAVDILGTVVKGLPDVRNRTFR
ncbi:hypothetical protein [Rhizobium mulingense]|nr:hypothetical protein [Rhizobium sp. MJ21]MEB3045650.1 hypothetical protein [Rhizobium sp. MJ21]